MLNPSQHSIVVGDRTLDLSRELVIDGRGDIVPLRPRAWLVLRLLATRAGRLVGKDEIMDEVWPDCEVTEDSPFRPLATSGVLWERPIDWP